MSSYHILCIYAKNIRNTVSYLVYYPIPESIGKYDPVSLFYYACETGQEDPLMYMKDLKQMEPNLNQTSKESAISAMIAILVNFGRIDLLDNFTKRIKSIMGSLWEPNVQHFVDSYYGNKSSVREFEINRFLKNIFFENNLFTQEQILENIFFIKSYYDSQGNSKKYMDDINYIFEGIIGIPNLQTLDANLSFIAAWYVNRYLELDYIQSRLDKYFSPGLYKAVKFEGNIEHLSEYQRSIVSELLAYQIESTIGNFGYFVYYPDEINNYRDYEDQLGLYYITSGRFSEYVNWKSTRLNYRDILGSLVEKYLNNNTSPGCNRWSMVSGNADLLSIIDNDLYGLSHHHPAIDFLLQ